MSTNYEVPHCAKRWLESLRRPKHTLEDDDEINLRETGMEVVNWIYLAENMNLVKTLLKLLV
jgi:hypothetical protein